MICLLSLLPFVVFCIYGAFKVDPKRWLETPTDGAKAVGKLSNIYVIIYISIVYHINNM